MGQDGTVNAGEIARLVDVGRAAVSNWRRRHEDFPRPVGGTASSPLFSLTEVETWLRRNGKPFQLSAADRAWQEIRAAGDDLRLGELVAEAGERLRAGAPGARVDGALGDLSAERGPAMAFEELCARYFRAHSRGLDITRHEVAVLMARLACAEGATVLDPACGVGTLLLAAGRITALGQEVGGAAARIAATRLELRGIPARIVDGDSLRADAFAGTLADAVLCDPPFNERSWGFDDLTGDPRWEYGMPPRGEPELAWVQHCLAKVRPGGTVAILMPTAAASRRPGRRIRGNLLRAGALLAVLGLGASGPDLWLLRRPEPGAPPPSRILLGEYDGDLRAVEHAWVRFRQDSAAAGAVRIIDLLDEDVDLSPARAMSTRRDGELVREFNTAADRLRGATRPAVPELEQLQGPGPQASTTVADLIAAGHVRVRYAPPGTAPVAGHGPMLTAGDVAVGCAASGRTGAGDGTDSDVVEVRAGDVVASPSGAVRVVSEAAVLGPSLARYRVDPQRVDPEFLAGVLRTATAKSPGLSSRIDPRRIRLPSLSLAEQRRYGAAMRELQVVADATREAAEAGQRLLRLGCEGLVTGHLGPQ
ncbi:N-6 DNA Methylase [Amycolatopsis marina]|uniref:N-6 DNA Methylase n=1 Tax=Amycolatopsis marina TaxID=490629 RepID=A0A1I1CFB7_9PSEU|nr:N-6 DNA methylase [Amycolatopsis marina]SFB60706.1 N-6 DNA Methylase [Amycolatopsis marina]